MIGPIAVLNHKGGVGKTTVTLGLASAAQAAGLTTLVLDLDAQGNASYGLRVEVDPTAPSVAELLLATERGVAADSIHPSGWGLNVDVIPSDHRLIDRDADQLRKDPYGRLATALDGATDDYDLVLIDCAPALGRVTANALGAASGMLLVAEPSALALRGIEGVERRLDALSAEGLEAPDHLGVVLNRVPPRGNEAAAQTDHLRKLVGARTVWQPYVPRRVVLAEAMSDGTPIHWWGARAAEVIDVFDHLLARLRRTAR